jgi:hypothetical protein
MGGLKRIDVIYGCDRKLGHTEIDETPRACPRCGEALARTVERER